MADLGKQFLDTDGLNALWTKHKKVQPFYQEIGTSGTNGWVNFLTVKGTTYMNHPLVVRLLCRGYSDSTMDVQFVSANNTTPTIQYFKQRIQPYSGTHAIAKPGYTYEDVDGVRYYKFWLKKNEAYGAIGVHVESENFYTNGAEDTGILTFPNVQSDTEPSGIVYVKDADVVYEAVPAKTATSAAAVKVGTNAMGQVVLGNALTKSDVGLGNVDNTSDANKPISTATQTALDGKVAKSGDTMTGRLTNTVEQPESIRVSHGKANTNASMSMTRTDTGTQMFVGIGAGGVNHGVFSNANSNWMLRADTSGNVYVNDNKATSTVHIGNSDVGSTTKPVYIDDGVIKAGTTYAGGTAVTLNGTSASGSTASFYAPTGAGTNHRFLRSNGSGAPSWYIPAADYTFNSVMWNTSGETHTFWAFRLKGIANDTYNNVLLSFDTYFWNNQKSSSDLIWIGWSNNGNQGLVATAGRFRIKGHDNNVGTPLEYYLVKNTADTAAACTVDLYIKPASAGNAYGAFYVNVLNSGNRDLDDIIEKKGTYNVDLPEGAIKILYSGTIGSADTLSTARELAVGLGNTSTTTKFDGSADLTNIRVTGTLPVANGGTGATTPAGAQYNLIDKATTDLGTMGDAVRLAIMTIAPSATNSVFAGYRTGSSLWTYMKGKMSSDTGVNISGNAATATSAGKLTNARELAVGLSNTSTTTTFDGSANVTNIKVSGTLPLGNGGTGSTTAAGARTNLSVYSKSEVDSLMSGRIEVVTALPATGQSGIIYYVGPTGSGTDKYDEYIWTGSAFIKVGEHSLDLSNYVNTVTTSGSGSVVTGVSKSGSTVTVTKGNISLDDLSDWAAETDVTISNVTYHTMWPVAPTSSNQVYGISINGGRLFRIYNNKGAYSVQAYDKDSDTTYTPQKLGIGYGTCTTAEATAAKVVTLTDYVLVKNGIVAVKFSYPLCASATLNINGNGAKPVYVGGAAVSSTNCKSVQAGDTGYFIYDGTAYHFLGTDRSGKSSITGLSVNGKTVTYTRADASTGTITTQDTTYSFADSYDASTNKGATVATVTNAINALDVSDISGFGAGKTLATLTETNGKIAATFQNISITKSQVSDFSHAHGNITNGGALQTNDITIASGDKLVVTDSSDSSKVARASISFDGSTTTQALTKAGTWATFNNYSHPAGSAPSKTGVPTGNVSPGFGGTFKVNQITTDSTSHVSAVTERTITIPNATATTSAAGLMSAADKTKLDNAITKKTGFAYRGTSGGPVFKIAEKTFTSKTTTHSEQLVFDVSYSTHPNAIATSRLVVSFRVDANTSATMGFITNTIIRKQGFVELPYKFYGAVDYANGKFTLYAKYISGSYVTVEAECILASSENTDLIDNVSVFKTTTAELPDTSKEETTIWVASADRAYGTDGYISYSAAKCDIFAERTPMGAWSLNNRNGVRIQLYTYTSGNESGATLVWDSDTATGDIKEKFLNAQETGTLLTTTAGQCIKVVYTGTTNSYFRALGVFMSVKVADNSHTATGHLRMSSTNYPSYTIDTYGSLVTAINSTNDFIQSAALLVEPDQPEGRIRVFGFRCLNTYTGGGTLIGTADAARAYDSSFTGTNSIKSALDGKVAKSGDTMTGQLVNTLADGNSAFVASHGTANKKSAVGATRTDTGVSVFMGVGTGGTNHGVYSETNANWIIRADTAGNVAINAGKATSTVAIGNSDIGSTTKPVYIDDGVIKAGSTYAGGTAVTLNNSSKAGSTASFYAPTAGGTSNYVLIGNGTTSAPTWAEKAPKAVVADYVNMLHTNEVNFKNVPTSGSNIDRVWFNYRNGDTDAKDSGNLITGYYFGNRNGVTTGVTLYADKFSGTSANIGVTRVTDANAAVPPLTSTTDTGNAADFFIGTSATNSPNTSYNFHIHTILFKISAGYRVNQFAMASASTPASLVYERAGSSSDGTTWTWSSWVTFNNYSLPLAANGTRGGIQIGYSESGTNYAVKLSSEKAYVTVPWTDTKQNVTLATTTKAFITGVSTTPTGTAQALTGLADTGVYLTTTAGELNATQYKVNEHCTMKYNSTKSSLDFTFS